MGDLTFGDKYGRNPRPSNIPAYYKGEWVPRSIVDTIKLDPGYAGYLAASNPVPTTVKPTGPVDGQRWIYDATTLAGNITAWEFQWNASRAVWLFIGGGPAVSSNLGSSTIPLITTWANLGPTIAIPFTGVWNVSTSAISRQSLNGNVQTYLGVWLGLSGGVSPGRTMGQVDPIAGDMSIFTDDSLSLATGDSVGVAAWSNGVGTGGNVSSMVQRRITLSPSYVT